MKIEMSQVGDNNSNFMKDVQAGFSLMEMLVVMSILGLAASMTFILYKPGTGANSLKAVTYKVASRIRDVRVSAIQRSIQKRILIDLNRKQINFGDGKGPLQFSKGINLIVTSAGSEQVSKTLSGIRFFPNGSSTGGVIKIVQKAHSYEIRVNWLTGRVTTTNALSN